MLPIRERKILLRLILANYKTRTKKMILMKKVRILTRRRRMKMSLKKKMNSKKTRIS